ncbi:MAG: hypothetical protein IBX63_06950 [Coriobacteriia bacterium]|nr:hypothetical protein [Coriobacteriia bacterium]
MKDEVTAPDEFACQLVDGDVGRAVAIVEMMAADTSNPPLSREQVLGSLENTVPAFVALVRAHLEG